MVEIECEEDTVIPIDQRVIDEVSESIQLDETFVKHLSNFHGGTPKRPRLKLDSGETIQIAWFVTLLDELSDIPGGFQEGYNDIDIDTRITDRSLSTFFLEEETKMFNGIVPFAALSSTNYASDSGSLSVYSDFQNDSLCFNFSTNPASVVICDAAKAIEQYYAFEDGAIEKYDISKYTEFLASSFIEFCDLLKEKGV